MRYGLVLRIFLATILVIAPACSLAQATLLNTSFEASAAVNDEAVTLTGTAASALSRSAVIPQTVVVEDQSATTTYAHGADYTVSYGSHIQRTPTSAIPSGATVLVSYRYSIWQRWRAYGYTVSGEGGLSSNPKLGAMGGESVFDVLFPDQGAVDGYVACGLQGSGTALNGGCSQSFTAGNSGFVVIKARSYSTDWSQQPLDIGNRVRAGLAPGTTTSRTAVSNWTEVAWGSPWSNIVVPVPAAGNYTLFIENHIAWSAGIWSSLWDYVKWSSGVVTITSGPSEMNVTETSADIVWDTDISSSSIVRYGVSGAPYTNTAGSTEFVSHHAAHLTGLTPGTQYYYQIESASNDLDPALSGERVFATVSPVQPALTNGDFEAVGGDGHSTLVPWSKFGSFDGVFPGPMNPDPFGVLPRGGSHFAGAIASYASKPYSGCLQRVWVIPGKPYVASAWVWTENHTGDPPAIDNLGPASDTRCRIGIDPLGGTDPGGQSVVWGPWGHSQDSQPPHIQLGYQKINCVVEIPTTSTTATVFLQVDHKWPTAWNMTVFDDVTFGEAIPVTSLAEAKLAPVGWMVDITNSGQGLLVTKMEYLDEGSPPAYVPYFWVQDDGRTNGAKVRLDGMGWTQQQIDAVRRGCRIGLKGRTVKRDLTDLNYGEVEILATDVSILSTVNADPRMWMVANGGIGGAPSGIQRGVTEGMGANNVGLLVRTVGRVIAETEPPGAFPSGYCFLIDDASEVTNLLTGQIGLKVRHPYDEDYWCAPPPEGSYVALTGVVCLEVCDPSPGPDGLPNGSGDEITIPTLRLRDGRDMQTYLTLPD